MLVRKYTYKPDCNKVQDLIQLFQDQIYDYRHPLSSLFLDSEYIRQYFYNLHIELDNNNLHIAKKMQVLQEGLYILLKGQINYQKSNITNEKENNLTKIKNNIKNSKILTISNAFSVFTAKPKTFIANQLSYLLKISDQQALKSKFYQYYNQRHDLCKNHFLPKDLIKYLDQKSKGPYLTIDCNLHFNFYYKTYSFRQKIIPSSVGIVVKGLLRLKYKQLNLQLSEKTLILPCFAYEAGTQSTTILFVLGTQYKTIQNSQYLNKTGNILRGNNYNYNQNIALQKINKNKNNYLPLDNPFDKQASKICKITEPFSIISTYKCQRNLDFSKRFYKKPEVIDNKSFINDCKYSPKYKTSYHKKVQKTNNSYSQHKSCKKAYQSVKYILNRIKLPVQNYNQIVKKYGSIFQNQNKTKQSFQKYQCKIKTYGYKYVPLKSHHTQFKDKQDFNQNAN